MFKSLFAFFKRPAGIVFVLMVLFFVPMILAFWWAGQSVSHDTTNRGQLLVPPLNFNALPLTDAAGKPFSANSLHGRWLLLYVSPFACDKTCQDKLYFMRQIQTATGKDRERIQRVLLTFSDQPDAADLPKLLKTEYAGTIRLNTTSAAYFEFMQSVVSSRLANHQGYIYIVDPHGNLFMMYVPTTPPMDIFKDLTHLLGVSQIG